MKVRIDTHDLVAALEGVLSRSPSRAGIRLCSERELALHLGTYRIKVQQAFDTLVEKGILLRRQGSGTYVRKVPKTPSNLETLKLAGRILSAKILFADPAKTPVRKIAPQEPRKLHLALLITEPNMASKTADAIWEGLKDRAKVAGHYLKVYYGDEEEFRSGRFDRLATLMRNHPCDGCVLLAQEAPVLEQIFGAHPPPSVYIGFNSLDTDLLYAPLVRIDVEGALQRALKILHKEGWKRIGIISASTTTEQMNSVQNLYEETMSKLGQTYRSSEFCRFKPEEILPAMRKMFLSPTRPDAVYVTDDVLLDFLIPSLKALKIEPGKNLGIITLANRTNPLPEGFEWSRLEFNSFQVGRLAMDSLLLDIQTVGESICSFGHLATWYPGETHLRDFEN